MNFFSLILSASLIMLIIGLPASSCVKGSPCNQEEDTGQENFSVKELQADFKQFRQFLEESHPKLYRFTSRREDLWMELKDEQTAILTIRTFAYYDDNKGFNRFIDSSFQVIHDHDIQHLVIDLRGNDGGDPFCSTHLLSYLQKKPVIYFSQPYGRYARLNKPLPMAENPYKGSQYYLIDGMCFSTTGHLTSLLRYYGLGTFIGEETGATYTCNDASHDTKLKHTGYRLQSARGSFATAVIGFSPDKGILPDQPVRQSIDEVIMNHDAVLEYTLQLIKQKNAI